MKDSRIPDPEKFVSEHLKKIKRSVCFNLIIELFVLAILGGGLGLILYFLESFFKIDPQIIQVSIISVCFLFIILSGYMFYKYYKALEGEDDWD
jgi:NAD kinase